MYYISYNSVDLEIYLTHTIVFLISQIEALSNCYFQLSSNMLLVLSQCGSLEDIFVKLFIAV